MILNYPVLRRGLGATAIITVKRVLLTGIAGFIGHHVAEGILRTTDWEIVGLDRLDTSGNLNRLSDIAGWDVIKRRVTILWHDLRSPVSDYLKHRIGPIDFVLHLAASTHVDRSIATPLEFVMDNVVGTCQLLDFARSLNGLRRFIYFSTDEVFGPAPDGVAHAEWDCYASKNPYAATKAGGEELALSYHNSFGVPVVVIHCMNVFGERQHPEKFIPKVIRSILTGDEVFIHASPDLSRPGSRFYLHARNVGQAIQFLLDHGTPGEKYNIVGEKELNNLELASLIAQTIGKPLKHRLVDFHSSRPGHDLRYALDGTKLGQMGFSYPKTFDQSLKKTVQWYLERPEWLSLEVVHATPSLLKKAA